MPQDDNGKNGTRAREGKERESLQKGGFLLSFFHVRRPLQEYSRLKGTGRDNNDNKMLGQILFWRASPGKILEADVSNPGTFIARKNELKNELLQ